MPDASTDYAGRDLSAQLLAAETFARLVEDCRAFVANEINGKGMGLRTAFGMVRRLKPDIVERAVREIMPDVVQALEPCYADYRAKREAGEPVDLRTHLVAHDSQVAEAVLAGADRRAERIVNRPIHSAYARVRGRAQREVRAAVPDIADIIARHAD